MNNQQFQYVMVTNWNHHWDKLGPQFGNSTLFTKSFIKSGIKIETLPESACTLFIKLDSSNQFEKSWMGVSSNFVNDEYKGQPAIRFQVSALQEIECPEQYKLYRLGWHCNSNVPVTLSLNGVSSHHSLTHPPFFSNMANCNWDEFEDYTYLLLRLLGIHELFQFPQTDNRGKADGFFILGSLAVLYDATLNTNFEAKKSTQVKNFINQLKGDDFNIDSITFTIKNTERQVWIITRGKEIRTLQRYDQVEVKEIPYNKLIEVYDKRLETGFNTRELGKLLMDLK